MAALKFNKNRQRQLGFTLIETMVAISILTIGLVAMATVMAEMTKNTSRSRYMSSASVLASEKLEDINKYPPSDPEVRVATGTAGSLTADLSNLGVNYFDDVSLSATGGGITETTSADNGAGGTVFTTVVHKADGTITSTTSGAAPGAVGGDVLGFHRRWIIEKDTPVVGVRRVTVLVTLTSPAIVKQVTFQMSTVRP
jgi:prepilin-type N-terminal cleavage/methylation domain-containing protein